MHADKDPEHNDHSEPATIEFLHDRLWEIGAACIALANTDPHIVPSRARMRELGNALIELAESTQRYPDTPEYQHLLGVADIPNVEPLNPDAVVHVYIISDNHLYSPDTGLITQLEGDALWAFNTLSRTRNRQLQAGQHMARGFRQMKARYQAFRFGLARMESDVKSILPPDTPVVLLGEEPWPVQRQFNPDIIITDMRGDQNYAALLDATPEDPNAIPNEPMSVSKIAVLAGASRDAVRKRLKAAYGDEAYAQFDPGREFPPEVTGPIIAALRTERGTALVPMPEGHARVRELIVQSGRRLDVSVAVQILQRCGYQPVQLNIDIRYSSRGGVWVVKEEGAVEILRTMPRRPTPTQAPLPEGLATGQTEE